MKREKRKRQIAILIILCILLIILISLMYIIIAKNKRIDSDFESYKAEVYNKMVEEMVMPNGIFDVKKNYIGDYDIQDFYRSIKKLSEEIITLSKKDEKNLEDYYEKNKDDIKEKTGITNFEKFKELKEYSRKQGEVKNFVSADIDTDSFENSRKYLSFNMKLNYDDNKTYNFNVHLMNNKASRIFVKYEIIDN